MLNEEPSKIKVVTVHFGSYFEVQLNILLPGTSPSDFYKLPGYTEPEEKIRNDSDIFSSF